MAEVAVEGDELVVRLSALEKVAALRGDVRVPFAAVRTVALEPRPWRSLRGVRAPGTGFPGLISYGVRRYPGGRDFAAVLAGRPTLRIDLDASAPFARLAVSVRDAGEVVARLRAAAGSG